LAESGSQNFVLPAILTSALHAEAAAELISLPGAAVDPKRAFLLTLPKGLETAIFSLPIAPQSLETRAGIGGFLHAATIDSVQHNQTIEETKMPSVICTVQVENAAKFEQGFRTRSELFKSMTVNKPIHFNVAPENVVVIHFEPDDLDKYMEVMDSRATEEAMKSDGVNRDTVKIVPLDKEFDPR
jgi:hypothetical protein